MSGWNSEKVRKQGTSAWSNSVLISFLILRLWVFCAGIPVTHQFVQLETRVKILNIV